MSENEAMIVGSEKFESRKSSALFNFDTNEWSTVDSANHDRYGSSLATLNGRIFVIGGGFGSNPTQVIEEFHFGNKSWTETGFELAYPRSQHSAFTMSVELFSHLCF